MILTISQVSFRLRRPPLYQVRPVNEFTFTRCSGALHQRFMQLCTTLSPRVSLTLWCASYVSRCTL